MSGVGKVKCPTCGSQMHPRHTTTSGNERETYYGENQDMKAYTCPKGCPTHYVKIPEFELGKAGVSNPIMNDKPVHLKLNGQNKSACGITLKRVSKYVTNVNFSERKYLVTCQKCLESNAMKEK